MVIVNLRNGYTCVRWVLVLKTEERTPNSNIHGSNAYSLTIGGLNAMGEYIKMLAPIL